MTSDLARSYECMASRPVLQLEDRYGAVDVWVLPGKGKVLAMRWPSPLVGGMVRAWTLGQPHRQPDPWQRGLEP